MSYSRGNASISRPRSAPAAGSQRAIGVVLGFTLALVAGGEAEAWAQLAPVPGTPYQVGSEPITYLPLTGQTNVTTDNDDGNFTVNIPFPFTYFDRQYTEIRLTTNGVMGFQPDIGTTSFSLSNTAVGSAGSPNNFIAPFWDDQRLYGQNSGWIGTLVEGSAPARTFTIEWHNLSRFGATGVTFSMRVRLYEGASGRFDVEYSNTINGTGSFSATMGFESREGVGATFRPCTTSCSQADFQALAGQRITLTQDPGVELAAVDVQPPNFVFLGAEAVVPVTIQSLHGNPIGPFDVSVEADVDRSFANPREIGRAQISTSPFQLVQTNVLTRATAMAGFSVGDRIYMRVVVDSSAAITETDETNNVAVSGAVVRVLQGRPDLRVDSVQVSRRAVNEGEPIDLFVRVSNAGGEPTGPTTLAAVLSSNPVITASDGILTEQMVELAPGQAVTATITTQIPPGTNSGTYYLGALADPAATIDELDESNNGLAAFRPVTVTGGAVSILTMRLPQAPLGQPYVALLNASGGSGQYEWRVSSGMLPQGVGLAGTTGEFFGRPTALGCESFEVSVSDVQAPSGPAVARSLELCVVSADEPLTIVTRQLPSAAVGAEYTHALVATGAADGADLEWSEMGLTGGLRLTADGILVGTPEAEGELSFVAQVSDGESTAQQPLTLVARANGNLLIAPTPLPRGQVGVSYQHSFETTGGVEPITWRLQLSRIDELGLDLTPDGQLTGIPTQAGTFRITVEARDSGPPGSAARDEGVFTLVIEDDGRLEITTRELPRGAVGQGYDRSVAALGGLSPYTWETEGRLPEGLTAATNPVTNELRIVGTPTAEASSNILVTVVDSEGRAASRAFVIDIGPELPAEVAPPPDGCGVTGRRSAGEPVVFLLLGLAAWFRRRPRGTREG